MKIDFHVHTRHSPDSIIRLGDLKRKSERLGIVPALTDHYSIAAHAEARRLGMVFIPGEEVLTDRGDLIGLYLNELIPKNVPFPEAIDRIHGQGGIAYLPHMYDYGRAKKHADDAEAAKVDVIETFNARCMDDGFNRMAKSFAVKNNLLRAAGSDSHFLFEFGSTWTEVPDFDLQEPGELLRALKHASMTTKKAPFFVRGPTRLLSIGRKLLKGI